MRSEMPSVNYYPQELSVASPIRYYSSTSMPIYQGMKKQSSNCSVGPTLASISQAEPGVRPGVRRLCMRKRLSWPSSSTSGLSFFTGAYPARSYSACAGASFSLRTIRHQFIIVGGFLCLTTGCLHPHAAPKSSSSSRSCTGQSNFHQQQEDHCPYNVQTCAGDQLNNKAFTGRPSHVPPPAHLLACWKEARKHFFPATQG